MGDIGQGRWLQMKGRTKRAWGALTGNEHLEAEGSADVVSGAVQESIGLARRDAAREIRRGADALARLAKRAAGIVER
jgi:uncharacterized protein YjbJ (UPF0337 family)